MIYSGPSKQFSQKLYHMKDVFFGEKQAFEIVSKNDTPQFHTVSNSYQEKQKDSIIQQKIGTKEAVHNSNLR